MAKDLSKIRERSLRYAAAPGAPFTDEEAPRVGEALDAMNERGVPVTPEAVVEEAAIDSNYLHKFFTWEDAQAATKCRLMEAQKLISSLMIVVHSGDEECKLRARHNIVLTDHTAPTGQQKRTAFVSVTEIRDDPAKRKQLVRQAMRELALWREKYLGIGLEEFTLLFGTVSEFTERK